MNFNELMAKGQNAHLHGDYPAAYNARIEAYREAGDISEQGRAARDIAATFDRMGVAGDANTWALAAFDMHNEAVTNGMPDALRERAASSMYVGSMSLRDAIRIELAKEPKGTEAVTALHFLRGAVKDIEDHEASHGEIIDQYRINISGRAAMAEGLYGRPRKALRLGAKAVALSALSESSFTSTFNLAMPGKDKRRARFNAFARGASAIAATLMSGKSFRKIALKIAQKTL